VKLAFLCTALCLVSPSDAASPENSPVAILAGSDADSSVAIAPRDPASSSNGSEGWAAPVNDNRPDQPPAEASEYETRKFTKAELCGAVASVATRNGLPIPFLANLIQQESGFKPHVVSPVGAQGIAQFMPRVASSYGLIDPFEPLAALNASGKLLSELVNRFGNLGLAAAAYNAGPKRVSDWLARRRKLPAETRNYVYNITGLTAEHWTLERVGDRQVTLPPRARCPDVPKIITVDSAARRSETPMAAEQKSAITLQPLRHLTLRHSMPQPSQFAMGLPVSRFAAMATPLPRMVKKVSGILKTAAPAPRQVHVATKMSEFISMPTPQIMVEDRPALRPNGNIGPAKKISKRLAGKDERKGSAHRIQLAAAR